MRQWRRKLHMTGDMSVFDPIVPIPSTFFVKQTKGKVAVTEWGVVRLCTDGAGGEKRDLELREALFMPGMKVNIFSLPRIRLHADTHFRVCQIQRM